MRDRSEGFVYFIQAISGGPIKIGWAGNVEERRAQLQTGNPLELVVLCTMPGNSEKEAMLHACLCEHRIRGEWFADCEDIRSIIDTEKRFAPHRETVQRMLAEQAERDPDGAARHEQSMQAVVDNAKRTAKRRARISRRIGELLASGTATQQKAVEIIREEAKRRR